MKNKRNLQMEAMPFLVAYKNVLEREVERSKKEINFFTPPTNQIFKDIYDMKKEELDILTELLECYKNGEY